MKKTNLFLLLCLSFSVLSCADKNGLKKISSWDPSKYTVQYGDTLYSIAWRYDLDFKSVARWNKIVKPYLIVPGQRLIMTAPVKEPANKTYLFGGKKATKKLPQATSQPTPDYSDPKNIPSAPPLVSSHNKNKNKQKKLAKYQYSKTKPTVNKARRKVVLNTVKNTKKINWGWPIKGKVISTFAANNNNRKGIDIKGKQDQKIRSSGDGVVVYSGAGLISYGKLVIIKHNERFLSAYAFNKKLLVKEGTRVNKGQSIAIIGKKQTVTNLLHFEIRKDGKPVNPLVYLP